MILLTEIHIATNCTGMLQQTKRIKPRRLESVKDLEPIRKRVALNYRKLTGIEPTVFFVYSEQ